MESARVEINRRLAAMNEVRQQLDRQAGTFLTKETFDRLHAQLTDRVALIEAGVSSQRGGLAMVGQIVTVVIALGAVLVSVLHHP
jgi:hypothetical protein